MCEYESVSQSAALRREARRRKILENSTNRLKLIEGVKNSTVKSLAEPSEDSHPHHDASNFENNDVDSPGDVVHQLEEEIEDYRTVSDEFLNVLSKESSVFNILKELNTEEEKKSDEPQMPVTVFLIEKKLHILFLAVLVNILLYFQLGYLFYDNILCPFYTVKIIEVVTRGLDRGSTPPILLVLLSVLPIPIQNIIKFLLSFTPLLFDFFFYLFIFILGAKAINI